MSSLSEFKEFVLTQLFPQNCSMCQKRIQDKSSFLCIECLGDLPKTKLHSLESNPVKTKFKGLIEVHRASSFLFFKKNNMVERILYQIKYNQNQELAIDMGRLFAGELKDSFFATCDGIIALPLHPTKQSLRGYNQAALISQGLSEILQIPIIENALIRTKNNISQTSLTREERAQNVHNIFKVKNKAPIENKNIILVDDVITTGATLEMAGQELLHSGVKSLNILTLACAFDI